MSLLCYTTKPLNHHNLKLNPNTFYVSDDSGHESSLLFTRCCQVWCTQPISIDRFYPQPLILTQTGFLMLGTEHVHPSLKGLNHSWLAELCSTLMHQQSALKRLQSFRKGRHLQNTEGHFDRFVSTTTASRFKQGTEQFSIYTLTIPKRIICAII